MNRNTKVRKSNKAVKAILNATFPNWRGRKVFVNGSGKVSFHDTNWGGGTRNEYKAITYRIANGKLLIDDTDHLTAPAPWNNTIESQRVQLPEGVAVVEHSYFCGKDCGVTIHLNMNGAPIAGFIS